MHRYVTGVVELIAANVYPEELDACDAKDAVARLAAGRDFAPLYQRQQSDASSGDPSKNNLSSSSSGGGGGGASGGGDDTCGGDASDPAAPAGDPIGAGKDVVMVELKGIDAYTRWGCTS